MLVRKAVLEDIDEVIRIKNEAIDYMAENGNDQWDRDYPTYDTFLNFIKNDYMYIIEDEEGALGIIGIVDTEDKEYGTIEWSPSTSSIVVHRMAIGSRGRGKGLATYLLNFAISEAKRRGADIIKMDTYYKNKPAQSLFKKLGFVFKGTINFPQRDGDYLCYEMVF